jgi:2-succinyl-6-hydroxy-2,4-cyclohexadiene-1-carboxylate synthase
MGSRLVLIHGFLGDVQSFQAVTQRLELNEPAFCPALYGHGAAVALSPHYEFGDEVRRLIALIEGYSGGTPVHIAGYSLGARLSLALLAGARGLFHSATLISARRWLDTQAEREARLGEDQRWAERLRTTPLPEFLWAWEQQPVFASMQSWALERREGLHQERSVHDPLALAQALTAMSLANMPNFADELALIDIPVVVLAGRKDAKFVALGQELVSNLPNGKFVVVDEAGHQLLIERPDAVAAAIREGLDHAQRYME